MIVVTGASGFIGGHTVKRLLSTYGSDKVVALTSRRIEGVQYVLHNEYNFTPDFFHRNGIEKPKVVIHAGAFIPKNPAQGNDWVKCTSNITNTHNLLHALPASVERFIFLSTIDIYGETDLIAEASPVNPVSLYASSKLYCEKLVESWAIDKTKIVQVLRIGHIYGPGEEKFEKIIPNTIRKLLKNAPIQIVGTGKDIRTFLYIEDAVAAIINSLQLPSYNGPINIAGSKGISISDLVMCLQKIAGKTEGIDYVKSDRPIQNLYFNNSKMRELLHQEKYELESGLKEEWQYMANLS
jgi:nucleoside-diphosphate-sugar epimerase